MPAHFLGWYFSGHAFSKAAVARHGLGSARSRSAGLVQNLGAERIGYVRTGGGARNRKKNISKFKNVANLSRKIGIQHFKHL